MVRYLEAAEAERKAAEVRAAVAEAKAAHQQTGDPQPGAPGSTAHLIAPEHSLESELESALSGWRTRTPRRRQQQQQRAKQQGGRPPRAGDARDQVKKGAVKRERGGGLEEGLLRRKLAN